jgi:hypothetical protein
MCDCFFDELANPGYNSATATGRPQDQTYLSLFIWAFEPYFIRKFDYDHYLAIAQRPEGQGNCRHVRSPSGTGAAWPLGRSRAYQRGQKPGANSLHNVPHRFPRLLAPQNCARTPPHSITIRSLSWRLRPDAEKFAACVSLRPSR